MTSFRLRGVSRSLGLSPRRRAAQGAAPSGIVQDGLVAEFRFDEGSGQVLTDYSGNGHHGRLGTTGGADADDPNWTSEGLVFTAATSDWVECDTAGLAGGMAFSIVAVAYYAAGSELAIEWPGNGSTSTEFTLKPFGVGFYLENGPGSGTYWPGLAAPSNQWNFLAWTQSTSSISSGIAYSNGFSDVAANASGSTSLVLNISGNLTFGRNEPNFRNMRMAYFSVYNRALSANEIEQNRAALASILAARGITLP
jgi:hypothetical protein